MNESRVSSRVLLKEAQKRQENENIEKQAVASVDATINNFFVAIDEALNKPKEFSLPNNWIEDLEPKRIKKEKVQLNHEVSLKVRKVAIPPFRSLRQNLYRPPLQRTLLSPQDCQACACKPGSICNQSCQNRLLYM